MPVRSPQTNQQQAANRVNTNGDSLHFGAEDEIVISGISGRFPESDSIAEFRDNLFAGIDLITDDDRRWPGGLYFMFMTRNVCNVVHV
jgi:fatty acid synthase